MKLGLLFGRPSVGATATPGESRLLSAILFISLSPVACPLSPVLCLLSHRPVIEKPP